MSAVTKSLTQVAEILGVHRMTTWSFCERGELLVQVLKICGSLRIVRGHLDLFIAAGIPVKPGNAIDPLTATG
jgi:hypothetical protein